MLWTASAQAELIEATESAEGAVGAVRRLAVASLVPGIGVSTLTAMLAESFAHQRRGRVLVAELRPGQASTMLSSAGTRRIETVTIEPGSSWEKQVAPVARNYDIVLTDGGTIAGIADLTTVAHSAHAVCLVTSDDRATAENAIALARSLNDNSAAPRAIVAFVDSRNINSSWAALVAPRLPFPVTRVPYDRAFASRSSAPRTGTRRGVLLTAAALFRQSEPGTGR